MSRTIYGIYGTGGFAREVLPLVREQINKSDSDIYFVVDDEYLTEDRVLNKIEIISFEDFVKINNVKKYLTVGFSDTQRRIEVFKSCAENQIGLLDVKASNVIMMDNVLISEGFTLCPFVTITSDVKIGKGFQANIYGYVAHDCVIGDFVTFAPAVKCNGNVHIEDNVYIGTGVIIYPGKDNKPLKIGKGAVIAAGSVVTKDVPAGMTVFGNPAIEFTRENINRRK